MNTNSPMTTGLLGAILAAVAQIEIGPHASACVLGVANIIAATVLAYLGRKLSNARTIRKQQARQRRQKFKPQHMVSTPRRRPPHKASAAHALNGLGSKRRTKSNKPNA